MQRARRSRKRKRVARSGMGEKLTAPIMMPPPFIDKKNRLI